MKKMVALWLLLILFYFSACNPADDDAPIWPTGPSEPAQNGAYYAAGSNGDWAVIYEDNISLFGGVNLRCDVVRFSREGDSYKGKNIRSEISFKISGDKMTVRLTSPFNLVKNKIINLKRNTSVVLSEENPVQVPPPVNVFYSSSILSWRTEGLGLDGEDYLPPSYILRNNGILGAGLEIKYAGTVDFKAVSISDFIGAHYLTFNINLPNLGTTQGAHILRIKHLGGPFVRDNKEIRLSLDSDPLYFRLTVDSESEIIDVEEISY